MFDFLTKGAQASTPQPPVRRKGGRPTKAEAVEKRKQKLEDMQTSVKLAEMERKLKRIQHGGEGEETPLDLETVKRVRRYLEEDLGLQLVHKDGKPVDNMLERLAPLVTPLLQGAGAAFIRNTLTPEQRAAIDTQHQLPAGSQPASSGTETPQATAPNTQHPALSSQDQQEAEEEMDFAAKIVKNALEGKPPEQRARWLLDQPMLSQLAAQLCHLQDGQLMPSLQQIAEQNPGYRAVSNWVLSKGELWIVETVREMRRLSGAGSAAVE